MGFFNKKTGENHLVKMSESVNKRVLRLLVKQMGVIGGIADDLPVKEEPMMCNKMWGFFNKRRENKIKANDMNTHSFTKISIKKVFLLNLLL